MMNMQASGANHYVTLIITGYTTGTLGYLPITPATVATAINNYGIRLAVAAINTVIPNQGLPTALPYANQQAAIANVITYITSRNDYYVMTFGRNSSHPITQLNDAGMFTDTSNTYNDIMLTSSGDLGQMDYNGFSHGSHIIPFKSSPSNSFDIYNNINKNEALTYIAYLVMQVYAFVPATTYTNIVMLPSASVNIIRLQSNAGNDKIADIIPPNVPVTATAILANIYSFQVNRADGMGHSFGRNNSHDANIFGNNIFFNAAPYYNDVLVYYEGKNSPVYYYGYSHGSNIIPLKANGRFDANLGIGKSATSGQHVVCLQVYGYVTP